MTTEVEYGYTYNMGNYESKRLSVRVELQPGEDVAEAFERARQQVERQHSTQEEVRRLDAQRAELARSIRHLEEQRNRLEEYSRAANQEYERLRQQVERSGGKAPARFHRFTTQGEAYIRACALLHISLEAPLEIAQLTAQHLLASAAEGEAKTINAALETVQQRSTKDDENIPF